MDNLAGHLDHDLALPGLLTARNVSDCATYLRDTNAIPVSSLMTEMVDIPQQKCALAVVSYGRCLVEWLPVLF